MMLKGRLSRGRGHSTNKFNIQVVLQVKSQGCSVSRKFILGLIWICVIVSPSCLLASDYGWGDINKCPTLKMLNWATQAYHVEVEREVFLDPAKSEVREEHGVQGLFESNDFMKLDTANFSSECRALNEKLQLAFSSRHDDRELDRRVPSMYPMYYRVGEYFVAIVNTYHLGAKEGSELLPPPPGVTIINVYDKKLKRIVSFSF